jgi:hypothetical protein
MAQTEHLPIYKAAYDLCLYFEQIVRGFSRYQSWLKSQHRSHDRNQPAMPAGLAGPGVS